MAELLVSWIGQWCSDGGEWAWQNTVAAMATTAFHFGKAE